MQKKMLNDQDKQLEEIEGIVKAINYENQNFGDEATLQNRMLVNLDRDIDKTTDKMVKVDNKLKRLIASSNHWCIWVIIIIEFIILIILLVT